jgi:hypothetical protein
MTPNEFADALRKGADVLAPNHAVQLRMFADMFASSPAATVATTVKRLGRAALTPGTEQPAIDGVLKAIAPLHEFVKAYGKPAVANDWQTVTLFLQGFAQAGVRPFVAMAVAALNMPTPIVPTLKEEVVQRHLQRLEQALGNDSAFTTAYNELGHDPEVGNLEIAALAKRFTDVASKSRSAALKKILARHRTLMTSKRKAESRDGRSAA